jgi:antibiotic biosynthesis monooxygenase (ABM) superfamily enzyme
MAIAPDLLIVTATIEPSVEKEWNAWYNDVHLPEIVECPGFKSAQRYVAQENDGSRSYVSVYELSDADALGSAEFGARRGWGPFVNQVKFKTLRYAQIAQIERP